jgi:hypothetical protein
MESTCQWLKVHSLQSKVSDSQSYVGARNGNKKQDRTYWFILVLVMTVASVAQRFI